ncbi:hypothetical protein N7493_005078 [Penicillium malachiteum]|uniref:C2H2-type domain-containing protein n=1 Tax=Penicillium malachiteum TaxID=1324776 RepID=A0AAD6MW76_9EURO|nr:hypothetical protein N7493_005078 [Penicillium malachiteum]
MGQKHKGRQHRIPCTQCDKTFSKPEHLNRHQLARDPEIDEIDRDILVPISITDPTAEAENSISSTEPPTALSLQLAGNGMNQEYHNNVGNEPSTELLDLLFNSPFQRPLRPITTSNIPPGLNTNIVNDVFQTPVDISPNGSTSTRGGNEGMANKIQASWMGNAKSTASKASPRFWQEIAFGAKENIFSSPNLPPGYQIDGVVGRSEISLTDSCKARLRRLKGKYLVCGCTGFSDDWGCGYDYHCINTTEVFEQGFYLYSRKYQPFYPVLHPATFDPDKTSDLLLFVMCMIGISFFKTDDAVSFIRKLYPIAQQYGYFCSRFDQIHDLLLSLQIDESARWIAWSRAESTKNPIIATDALVVCLPMEINLYKASTSSEWSQLLDDAPCSNETFELSSHHFHLPNLQGHQHALSMYGLLCSILLRVLADTHRLITSSDLVPAEKHQYVPWNVFRLDKRASIVAPLLASVIHTFEGTLRQSNPNCIVIWHSVCMLLTADMNVLSSAAGRNGPECMLDARQALISWAYTPAARRACLHAAQSIRILSHRKPADGTAFQSVRTLFMSALVLAFYLLAMPETACLQSPTWVDFDLASSDIDWTVIGDEGLSNLDSSDIEIQNQVKLEDAAVRFVRFGGPILIDGKRYEPGARHAQRIILEVAGLLDEVGTHWMAGYSQILYMIHDTMVTVTP